MAKKAKDNTLDIVMRHYASGTQEMDQRRVRKNGWNETIDAYMGKLPNNWPYLSVVTDPRIRTTILEKTSRLLNNKLRGRLVPREGGDVVKAEILNSILDFQWDHATEGGAMIEKIATADQHTRLFGSSFTLVYWKHTDDFDGPEIKVIDPRDVFIDHSATHIRNAKWVQVREFTTIEQLETKYYGEESPWKNLDKLKDAVKSGATDSRQSRYESQVKINRGVEEEPDDPAFSSLEIVTEYRPDRCITFAPRYGVVLKDTENPYEHDQIPVAQLRYYPLIDDVWGESEVEPVMPIQKAINSLLCGFVDEMNMKMRPPLKVASSGVRIETIAYGPGALWVMNNPTVDVIEHNSGGQAINNFNSSYSALVAAFSTAMGESSLGVSNIGDFQKPKTATEINKTAQQQNSRDQYNQLYLEQYLKDIMMMWLSMNKQFLFDDPNKAYQVIRIIGKDKIRKFQQMKLDTMDIPRYAMDEISDAVMATPDLDQEELMGLASEVSVPTNPVIKNPNETNPDKMEIVSKLNKTENDNEAELYVTPDDMDGVYDYIPDVKSMALGVGDRQMQAKQDAITLILNPAVQQMLQAEGQKVKIKEMLVSHLDSMGYGDAEALFENATIDQNGNPIQAGPGTFDPSIALKDPGKLPGISELPQAVPGEVSPEQLPQPEGLPVEGEIDPGLLPSNG